MTLSAAVTGALGGPLLGSLAADIGAGATFGGVAAAGAGLAAWVWLTPGTPVAAPPSVRRLAAALGERQLATGLGLIALSPLLFSVLTVLVPLELAGLGWSTARIGGVYLVTAALEALAHPLLGRWADRAGPLPPVQFGLAAALVVLLLLPWPEDPWAVAALVLLAGLAFGAPLVPGIVVATRAGDEAGLGMATSFGLTNLAWALGYALGAPAGGAMAEAAGDPTAYATLAGVCGISLLILPRLLTAMAAPRR